MTEYTYITLHVPLEPSHAIVGAWGHQLSRDLRDWLDEFIGQGAPDNHSWYLNLDNDQYQWFHMGLTHDPDGRNVRTFRFRNEKQAMLFKLRWMA